MQLLADAALLGRCGVDHRLLQLATLGDVVGALAHVVVGDTLERDLVATEADGGVEAVYDPVWTRRRSEGPQNIAFAATTFDERRGSMVLVGGFTSSFEVNNRVWEYDGVTWTAIDPATGPPAAINHSIVYDPDRGHGSQ